MKQCPACQVIKPMDAFYAHPKAADGYSNKCKECTRKAVKANRDAKRDYYLRYDRNRPNKAARLAKVAEYQKTERGKAVRAIAGQNYAERWPGKRAAHIAVRNSLRDGRLVRPAICSACEKACTPEAHHSDYSKPLDVMWLCTPCHKQWHRENQPIYPIAA
jgi:hypothetical protein